MLIPLDSLLKKYKIKPKGVLHVGASTGQEAEDYKKAGIEHTFWVEPIPEIFNKLDKHVEKFNFKSVKLCNILISDIDDDEVDFHIANNEGQSSSMLEFGTHTKEHPTVKFTRTVKMKTARIDKIFTDLLTGGSDDFDPADYDFLNIDVQGAELKVLKSLGTYIHNFNSAYIEVNEKHLYKDCPLVNEIDDFLLSVNMHRVETKMTGAGWGDAYYVKF